MLCSMKNKGTGFPLYTLVHMSCSLGIILFLLQKNDLLVCGTFGYPDDSTVVDSDWGDANLVTVNAAHRRACVPQNGVEYNCL